MSKKMIRVGAIYGRGNPIPVGKTRFYQDFVLRDETDPFVPDTKVRRLRLHNLGENSVIAFDDEIDALVEALRAFFNANPTAIPKKRDRDCRRSEKHEQDSATT